MHKHTTTFFPLVSQHGKDPNYFDVAVYKNTYMQLCMFQLLESIDLNQIYKTVSNDYFSYALQQKCAMVLLCKFRGIHDIDDNNI